MHTLRKKRSVLVGFTERKKGTLLFKGKTESPVLRNTREGEKNKKTVFIRRWGPGDHDKWRSGKNSGDKEKQEGEATHVKRAIETSFKTKRSKWEKGGRQVNVMAVYHVVLVLFFTAFL